MSKRRGLPETSRMRHDAHFVDQLVRADEIPIGRRIPIELIEANPDQPRSMMGDLTELKSSVQGKGILEPILVRAREDGRFTIISGERRFRAAMEVGLREVPCIEMDVNDAELLEIALIENLQRKDLTPFEEAEGYLVLQEKHGYTHEKIASTVGKSRVTVTETLSLARLPLVVRDECRRADIKSKSFLLEVSRLDTQDDMLEAVRLFREGGSINRDELRSAKRDGSTPVSSVPLKKAYSLEYRPEGRDIALSLVVRSSASDRETLLAAVRELARGIESGAIDIDAQGRFTRMKTSAAATEPTQEEPDQP